MTDMSDESRELEIEVIETDKGDVPTFDGMKAVIEQIYKDFELLARPFEKIIDEIEVIKKKQDSLESELQKISSKIDSLGHEAGTSNLEQLVHQELKKIKDELKTEIKTRQDEQNSVNEQLLSLIKKMSVALLEYYQDLDLLKKSHQQDITEARLLLADSITLLERTVNELRSYVLELMRAFMTEPKTESVVDVGRSDEHLINSDADDGLNSFSKKLSTSRTKSDEERNMENQGSNSAEHAFSDEIQ